ALSSDQKTKLALAGRADIDRFFKRVGELKPRIKRVYDELAARRGELDDALEMILRETRSLRRLLDSTDWPADSLFAKTVRTTLSPEQAAAYETARAKEGAGSGQSDQRKKSRSESDD